MKKVNTQTNSLIEVLGDILAHLHPETLNEPHKSKINIQNCDKEKLDKYQQCLFSIKIVYDKILKYELYFSEFYPQTDKITNLEALKHHFHAYLEDLDRLRNKIITFLGLLKNDLKKISLNEREIDQVLKQFIEKIEKTFKRVKDHRHPHHHAGFDFLDSNLVEAEGRSFLLQEGLFLQDRLNVETLRKEELEFFEKAKNNWITQAQKNNKQIYGLVDMTFQRNRNFIYKVLKINSIK